MKTSKKSVESRGFRVKLFELQGIMQRRYIRVENFIMVDFKL